MYLVESTTKELLRKTGIATPHGLVMESCPVGPVSVRFPVVVKAQVPVWRRAEQGGVVFADSQGAMERAIEAMLGTEINGYTVRTVLVEEKADITTELFLSISLERDAGYIVMLAEHSTEHVEEMDRGGFTILSIDPVLGFQDYLGRALVSGRRFSDPVKQAVQDTAQRLFELHKSIDARLLEINPLGVMTDGRVVALDAKGVVDENAQYRQPQLGVTAGSASAFERALTTFGIRAVEMGTGVAIVTSGAGLGMATMDSLRDRRVEAGAFVDLGPSVFTDSQTIASAIRAVRDLDPPVILLNFYVQVVSAMTISAGIRSALEGWTGKLVVRLKGKDSEKALNTLGAVANMEIADTYTEACDKVKKAMA